MDLLTTYTRNSELQVITEPSLISTIYPSLHAHEALSSLFFLHQPFPGSDFDSGDSSASRIQVLS
jgi:hypothetical protein